MNMNQNEIELYRLKEEISVMWKLVISQLEKAKKSLIERDVAVAKEIIKNEKKIDSLELKIDRSCEDYIALYNPVAIDLRLSLSIMKISINLERIGDYAVSVAKFVKDKDCDSFNSKSYDSLKVQKMFDILLSMMFDSFIAFNTDNSHNSTLILAKDKKVNKIFRASVKRLTKELQSDSEQVYCGLKMMLIMSKLERIGDICNNIVEEIVFYLDAKVLKHKGKSKQ